MKTLGERIAERRKELRLTQANLAQAAGVSIAAVSQWESGKTENVKLDHLFAIADLLEVHPRWLAIGKGAKLNGVAAKMVLMLFLAIPPFMAPQQSSAAPLLHNAGQITHMLRFWRRWRVAARSVMLGYLRHSARLWRVLGASRTFSASRIPDGSLSPA